MVGMVELGIKHVKTVSLGMKKRTTREALWKTVETFDGNYVPKQSAVTGFERQLQGFRQGTE
jgi:hypothetical protein